MRYLARIVLLGPVLWIFVPSAARADKKADAEYDKINPPVPYKLFVAASPKNKFGAEQIQRVFAAKNAKKIWRPTYDTWFTVVPEREVAEITIDVDGVGMDEKRGYKTVYYITGRLTITGIVKDTAIRGDDTDLPGLDLLRRILYFMRDHHKEAVLAHTWEGKP